MADILCAGPLPPAPRCSQRAILWRKRKRRELFLTMQLDAADNPKPSLSVASLPEDLRRSLGRRGSARRRGRVSRLAHGNADDEGCAGAPRRNALPLALNGKLAMGVGMQMGTDCTMMRSLSHGTSSVISSMLFALHAACRSSSCCCGASRTELSSSLCVSSSQ